MNCGLLRRHIDAYVDGEVDPTTQIEFERHLSECAACQECFAFERAFRGHLHESLCGIRAPSSLKERIQARLEEATPPSGVHVTQGGPHVQSGSVRLLPLKARHAVPLAAAAATMLVFSSVFATRSGGNIQAAGMGPILEDVVRLHSSALPPDVDGDRPQQVNRYFRNKLEFPVWPAEFDRRDARFVGARLSNVGDRRAALLYYDVNGRRVTVVVFDQPTPIAEDTVRVRLQGRELLYQHVRGHAVPMRRHAGLTYAFTGDLDRETLLRLAASARVPN